MNHLTSIHDITINFGKINQYIVLIIVFLVSLIIGISGSTDIYEKFNRLPDDRNELTPIKRMDVSIINGNSLFVHVQYEAITHLTIENLYNNIKARVDYKNISFFISASNAESSKPQSNYFEFTYKLPAYENNISVQLFLIDTPISKVYFFDVLKVDENEFQSYTTFHQNEFNNVCINKGRLQLFFKGKPEFNMKQLAIPAFQDYDDFQNLKEKNKFYSKRSILIYNNPDKKDPFSMATTILHGFQSKNNNHIFVYKSDEVEIFQDLFDIKSISQQILCFSSLQMQGPYYNTDSTKSLKSEILNQLKEKDTSSEQTFQTKQLISYFSHDGSSISNQNDVFQAICPECEINSISSSKKYIDTSNLYKIASSKVVIGFHSDLLVSAYSLYNTKNDCVIIDLLPIGLQGCGEWIKNMKEVAKTIVYFISNGNGMNYNYFCNDNYDDCKNQKCMSLLNGNFRIDVDKIKKAIDIRSSDCPSNLVSINESGVFCHGSNSFY